MTDFKIGDRVKRTGGNWRALKTGGIYTVTDFSPNGDMEVDHLRIYASPGYFTLEPKETMFLTLPQLQALEERAISLIPKPVDPAAPGPENPNATKANRVMRLAKAHFAEGHQKGLRHLIAALCDIDVKELPEAPTNGFRHIDTEALKGRAVIMLKDMNNHGYTLDRPLFLTGQSAGVCREFDRHGDLVTHAHSHTHDDTEERRACWRFATAEEIKAEIQRARALIEARPVDTAKILGW